MQIDPEQDQPPQEDGEYGRPDSLDRAQVVEVVVLLSDDQAHNYVNDEEKARNISSVSHGSSITS
jgi:hypothetical protein